MGTVYLAHDRQGRAVALKLLHAHLRGDPLFRHRFGQEVAAAARVASFCTARVLDADPHARQPFLVTEYVAGVSLYERVARDGPLPEPEVATLAVGVAAALTAIHAAGVVHRDLKPGNVMLGRTGPKVIDFGIAGAIRAAGEATTGIGLCTPRWSAPEQLAGRPAGPPADVFAWGLLTAWASTGRHPFAEGRLRADLAGLPPNLVPIVQACLAAEPAERPSARQVLLWLCGAGVDSGAVPGAAPARGVARPTVWPAAGREPVGGPPHSSRRRTPPPTRPLAAAPAAKPARRRRWPRRLRRGLLLALVGVLATGAWLNNDGRQPDAGAGSDPARGGAAPARKAAATTARDGAFEFKAGTLSCGQDELGEWPVRKRAEGMFCVLDLRISNVGSRTAVIFMGSQRLVTTTGDEYTADAWAWVYHPDSRPLAGTVESGGTVTGALVFDVPRGARATRLVVHDTPLSRGTPLTLRG